MWCSVWKLNSIQYKSRSVSCVPCPLRVGFNVETMDQPTSFTDFASSVVSSTVSCKSVETIRQGTTYRLGLETIYRRNFARWQEYPNLRISKNTESNKQQIETREDLRNDTNRIVGNVAQALVLCRVFMINPCFYLRSCGVWFDNLQLAICCTTFWCLLFCAACCFSIRLPIFVPPKNHPRHFFR